MSRVLSFLAALAATAAAADPAGITIVPRPVGVEARAGRFVLGARSVIVADRAAGDEARTLAAVLAPATGFQLRVVVTRKVGAARRRHRLCPKTPRGGCRTWIRLVTAKKPDVAAEGYTLDVFPGMAVVRGGDAAGLFYGGVTLRQLLPPAIFSASRADVEWSAPAVHVVDQPRFPWRGAMLDSARHLVPKADVLKLVDLLALHKLNRFHWHLSDDQGWRIEIRKYPKLTTVGSQRAQSPVRIMPNGAFLNFFANGPLTGNPTVFDGVPHGGFYTQDDVREVVAFAAARHVEIVPEIDMPGHISSAIAAYPELGNTGVPIPVATEVGILPDILNVEEGTFAFLEDVLDELFALFPGQFVHLGGDEVLVDQWEASPQAQARMAELGLTDAHGLETYVTNRMGAFVVGRGRRYVGWNDILRDGLAPDAAVMAWLGAAPGVAAAKAGRDVVMAPVDRTYLDYPNALPLPPAEQAVLDGLGIAPSVLAFFVVGLEKVYGFEPVPSELTAAEAAHVLGGQGQLWTEWIADGRDLDRQGFPRLAALAEAVWTPVERRDFADFSARLATHLPRLDAKDVCWFGSPAAACQ